MAPKRKGHGFRFHSLNFEKGTWLYYANLGVAPSQDASDHQDCYIVNKESL